MNDYYNEVQLKFIIKMQKKLFNFWRTSSPDSQPGLWPSALLGDFRPQTLSCPRFVFPRCALADDGNVSATKLSHAADDWEAPVEDDEVQICRTVCPDSSLQPVVCVSSSILTTKDALGPWSNGRVVDLFYSLLLVLIDIYEILRDISTFVPT